MPWHERFNRSGLSRFINSPAGRAFRIAAGLAFLAGGWASRQSPLGVAALAWAPVPLSAGAFDWCYVSAALGGPLRGRVIRARTAVGPGAGGARAA